MPPDTPIPPMPDEPPTRPDASGWSELLEGLRMLIAAGRVAEARQPSKRLRLATDALDVVVRLASQPQIASAMMSAVSDVAPPTLALRRFADEVAIAARSLASEPAMAEAFRRFVEDAAMRAQTPTQEAP